MKIELKRKVNGKYQYIDTREISGVSLFDILSRESNTPESCMKITNGDRVTIVTDDMLHHTHYCMRGYRMMCWKDAINLLGKHYGDKLLNVIPEEVSQLWPGAAFVGCDDEEREVA